MGISQPLLASACKPSQAQFTSLLKQNPLLRATKCQEGKPCQPQKQGKFLSAAAAPGIAARAAVVAAADRGARPAGCRRKRDTGTSPAARSGQSGHLRARYWKNTDRQKAAQSLTSSTQMPPARSTLCMRREPQFLVPGQPDDPRKSAPIPGDYRSGSTRNGWSRPRKNCPRWSTAASCAPGIITRLSSPRPSLASGRCSRT